MMDLRRALASLDMPPSKYLVRIALPLVALGVLTALLFRHLLPDLFPGPFEPLWILIPLFFACLALVFPYVVAESRKHEIDRNIHFFITHMGVLATSQIPRAEILRILGEKKEYGALASEARKIYALVHSWNMSLAEACRLVSKRTPSEIFADFLDRFAYALESGEELESFLKNEQIVVMEDFSSFYRGKLYELENLKGVFNSLMMSMVFVIIFALLMPVITGIDPVLLLGGALFLVLFIEVAFVYFSKAKAPSDPLWHSSRVETPTYRLLKRTLPVSCLLSYLALILALNYTNFPLPVVLAVGLSPLLVSGLPVAFEEERIKRREDSYAAFMRSLGASTSARGGAVTEVLRHLQYHDFGPLTENIRNLYRRLNLRIHDERAWEYFSAECGSNLIEKFNRMFVEGMRAGGKPDAIGRIISDNFVRIVALRKSRYQLASSYRGLFYGLMAGVAFSLFVGVNIISMLQRIFQGLSLPAGSEGSGVEALSGLFHFSANVPLLSFLVVLILLVHAGATSLMMKMVDGGNPFRSYVDFVGLFWVAALVGVGAEHALRSIL